MMNDAVYAVVGIPFAAGIILALIPGYKITAIGNVFAAGLTFIASIGSVSGVFSWPSGLRSASFD